MPFHVSTAVHKIGAVLEPGHWGAHIDQFHKHGAPIHELGTAFILMWEAALEAVRAETAPGVPSRLSCNYVVDGLEDATQFRNQYRPGSMIYRVSIVLPGCPQFVGDYALLRTFDTPIVRTMAQRVRDYWRGENANEPERLVGGPIRIEEVV